VFNDYKMIKDILILLQGKMMMKEKKCKSLNGVNWGNRAGDGDKCWQAVKFGCLSQNQVVGQLTNQEFGC